VFGLNILGEGWEDSRVTKVSVYLVTVGDSTSTRDIAKI